MEAFDADARFDQKICLPTKINICNSETSTMGACQICTILQIFSVKKWGEGRGCVIPHKTNSAKTGIFGPKTKTYFGSILKHFCGGVRFPLGKGQAT